MTDQERWFVAQGIFQAIVHTDQGDLSAVSEDLLFLVRANDHTAAVARAETIARTKERSYKNQYGQRVSWIFVCLVEITEMISPRFEEGAELKSKMTDLNEPTTMKDVGRVRSEPD